MFFAAPGLTRPRYLAIEYPHPTCQTGSVPSGTERNVFHVPPTIDQGDRGVVCRNRPPHPCYRMLHFATLVLQNATLLLQNATLCYTPATPDSRPIFALTPAPTSTSGRPPHLAMLHSCYTPLHLCYIHATQCNIDATQCNTNATLCNTLQHRCNILTRGQNRRKPIPLRHFRLSALPPMQHLRNHSPHPASLLEP